MSQYVDGGSKGFVATAALGEGIIVKLASGEVVAGAAGTDDIIGVTMNSCEAGEQVSVRLRSAAGTLKVKAGGAVAVGDSVTSDASGEAVATTTAGDTVLGTALEAAADGDLFEVLPGEARY